MARTRSARAQSRSNIAKPMAVAITTFRVCSHGSAAATGTGERQDPGRRAGGRDQPPDRGEQQDRRCPVRKDRVGVRHDCRGRRRDRPPEPGRGHVAGRSPREPPQEPRPSGGQQEEERRGAAVSAERVRRGDEGRHTGCVDRVDVPVLAALQVIGLELVGVVLQVVAARVIVVDAEITVVQQALRDDQVVRLVTRGQPARRPAPREGEHARRGERRRPRRGAGLGDEGHETRRPANRCGSGDRHTDAHPQDGHGHALPQQEGRRDGPRQQGQQRQQPGEQGQATRHAQTQSEHGDEEGEGEDAKHPRRRQHRHASGHVPQRRDGHRAEGDPRA